MQEESATIKNMKMIDAAKELGKSQQYLRLALQDGRVPFGMAIKKKGKKKFDYYINPKKFYEYISKPLPEKYKEKEELQGTERYTVITDPTIAKTITWRR